MLKLMQRIFAWLSQAWRFEDGIDLSDYVAHLERHFKLTISEVETVTLYTLADLADLISRKLAATGRALPDNSVWQDVRRITSVELGVWETELKRETRFVEDLCC